MRSRCKIREVAGEHRVPIVENPPLARALYATVDIDEEIPVEHYQAVAEVIGYVLRLKAAPRLTRRVARGRAQSSRRRPQRNGRTTTAMSGTTATTAIDRSDKPGHVGIILLVAALLVGAAIALGFIANEWAQPLILGLLALLSMIGVFGALRLRHRRSSSSPAAPPATT